MDGSISHFLAHGISQRKIMLLLNVGALEITLAQH